MKELVVVQKKKKQKRKEISLCIAEVSELILVL